MQTQYKRLTDPQWEIMKECLPIQRKRKYDLRDIVDAILWYLRVGGQWRNLPESYPPYAIVYYYFGTWKRNGTLDRLNVFLNQKERKRVGKEATPSMVSIDTQSVKAVPFVQEARGVDGNKRINGRKRHVLTDTLGLVWGVVVHAANRADGATAQRVVAPLQGYLHRMKKILADAAYEKNFLAWVQANMLSVELEISSRPPSQEGFVPVKWRWVTERCFGSFNFFRRLDKDHEKTTRSAEAWVLWQNCQMIINRLA
ncbi:IS5 family transposase [Catalinimonas sp. 4WD22]|uniref:IS5 family transposase n=1 Tax=Catalinimonas locisalis TaxID=3133978 RepID=UPI0031018FCD